MLPILCSTLTGFAQPKSEPPRPPPLNPAQAEQEARILVHDILVGTPDKNSTNVGLLKIRDAEGKRREIPVRFEVFSTAANWAAGSRTMPLFPSDDRQKVMSPVPPA